VFILVVPVLLLHFDPQIDFSQLQLLKLKLDVHNVQNESNPSASLRSAFPSSEESFKCDDDDDDIGVDVAAVNVDGVCLSSLEKSKLTVSTPHSRKDLFRVVPPKPIVPGICFGWVS
jgi:hypothetical protein